MASVACGAYQLRRFSVSKPFHLCGNPYFIDLDMLVEDGLLRADEVRAVDWGADETQVDYGVFYEHRFALLAKAAEKGLKRDAAAVAAFASEKRGWLEDYALFMALKRHFAMKPWMEWPEEVRLRKAEALERYRTVLSEDVALFTYIQYLFYRQWAALRAYARERGVGIIGDLPIYVAMDSADVWASPESFQLDEKNVPIAVAGVPPDYFSADGQLWGNPLYRWGRYEKKTVSAGGSAGWKVRRSCLMCCASTISGGLRVIGRFLTALLPPAADSGSKGPGMDLVNVLTQWFIMWTLLPRISAF